MASSLSCPSPDRLQGLLAGTLPTGEQEELIAHLDDCAACQQTLDQLAGADPALLGAVNALQQTALQAEPPLRRVLDELTRDANRTLLYRTNNRTAWLPSILQPATSPEFLGRFDQYEVSEQLGQGGMGLVLKAFDLALKRWVAIKVLSPDLAGDQVARLRFAREAQAAAAVRHPHVITIHSVNEVNGLPFLVMEYIAGGSLQDYLDSHGPPDWQVIAQLGAAIASGLAAAHARGLVHRDVKPSNILLEKTEGGGKLGIPKLSDFGLACAADEVRLTRTGIVSGTPMYMAPEQALAEPIDARADLFSLGSVLYTLGTGGEPFEGSNPMAVLRQVCETRPRPMRELNPAIPDWLAATVERLHSKKPRDRFASAAEVAELLRYNLEHPDHQRQVAPAPSVSPSRKKRWLQIGALAGGLLLTIGFLVSESLHWTHWIGWGRPEASRAPRVLLRATLSGHQGPVWSVAYAPDGSILATGSDDATLRLWDAATGAQKAELAGHRSAIFVVAFAHSGKFLISGGSDGTLRLWDATTWKQLRTLPHRGGNVRRLAISPDDKTVATGASAQDVELWDLDTHKIHHALTKHQGTIQAIAFAPNGQLLATGDASGYIQLWDPTTGADYANFRGDPLGMRALAFSPDGKILASAGSNSREVKFWDVVSRELRATLSGYTITVLNVAFSPDGRLLATGSRDGTVKIWDVASTQVLDTLPAHQGSVWSVAFSPDGHTLATVGEDRLGKLWDLSPLLADLP